MNTPLSTLRLYEISAVYLDALETLSEQDDLPPEAIADTLEGLAGEFSQKATAVAAYIRNLELEAEAIEAAGRRLAKRQFALQDHASRLRDYLQWEMEHTGIRKVESTELVLRIQANPPSVIIDDELALPEEFKQPVVTIKLLKAEISKALKMGAPVPGAHLEQNTRLVIS